MNCDQVFDILTRGPFPTGTDCDQSVEAHLSVCPECHRLAEALRPALELFQEAVDPEEGRDLPGYWTAAGAERAPAVMSYASEVEPRPRRALLHAGSIERLRGYWTPLHLWRMAAMVALGVTLGVLASGRSIISGHSLISGTSASPYGSELSAAVPVPPAKSIVDRMQWAALPAACFGGSDPQGVQRQRSGPLVASLDIACCSGCHNAVSDRVPKSATLAVAQSCQACHAGQAMSAAE